MTQIKIDIKMFVEGYREISQKQLDEGKEYYVQLQTSYINDNGDLEQKQVKLQKEIDFKSLVGKCVRFKNVVETVVGFDKFYKAEDFEIIDERIEKMIIDKYMIMNVIAISDKSSKDFKTQKEVMNGFVFSKDIVDGAIETTKVKIKNTTREKLAKLKDKTIKLNNLSEFKPEGSFVPFYSIESIKDISIIKN